MSYALTYVCLPFDEGAQLQLDLRVPGGRGPVSGPFANCDGIVHEEQLRGVEPRSLSLIVTRAASWRIVIRRPPTTGPTPPPEPAPLAVLPGQEQLVSVENKTTGTGSTGSSRLAVC